LATRVISNRGNGALELPLAAGGGGYHSSPDRFLYFNSTLARAQSATHHQVAPPETAAPHNAGQRPFCFLLFAVRNKGAEKWPKKGDSESTSPLVHVDSFVSSLFLSAAVV